MYNADTSMTETWRSSRVRWDRAEGRPRPNKPIVVDADGGFVHCGNWSAYLTVREIDFMLVLAGAFPEHVRSEDLRGLVYGERETSPHLIAAILSIMRRRLRKAGAPFRVVSTTPGSHDTGYRLEMIERKAV